MGIDGLNECMDIRIIDDCYDLSLIPERMNTFLPEGIRVREATDAKLDAKLIAFAKYTAGLSSETLTVTELAEKLREILSGSELVIEKKTKAGMKEVDLLPYIKEIEITENSESVRLNVTLPAGNTTNIGLTLLLKAIERYMNSELNFTMIRHGLFTEEMKPFA